MKELSKDVDQVIEGPIVAVQYPSVAPFTVNESTASELTVKYSHLKNLDVDDKKAYKELVAAIKDVSSNRIQINKEEDTAKKPLNEFRNLILETGKKLRAKFKPIEDSLKAEKERIDTILADREAAKRKVWQDNLDDLRSLHMRIDHNMKMDELVYLSSKYDKNDLSESCFGDLFEEAKDLAEKVFNRVTETIKYKKEQAEFEAKRIAFEKEQAEAAERERIANEEREAMAKRIAELEAASKPETVEIGSRGSSKTLSVTNEMLSESGASVRVDIDGGIVGVDMASGPDGSVSAVVKTDENGSIESIQEVKRTEERYTPSKPKDYPDFTINKHDSSSDYSMKVVHDGAALGMFIASLGRANNMRVITKTKEQSDAVERVKSTLEKAVNYLNGFDDNGIS